MVIYVLGHIMINSSPWLNSDRSLIIENNWQVSLQWDVIDFPPSLYRSAEQSINSELAQKNIVIVSYFRSYQQNKWFSITPMAFFPPGPWKWGHLSFVNLGIKKNALTNKQHLWFQSLPALVLICLVRGGECVFRLHEQHRCESTTGYIFMTTYLAAQPN